MGGTDQKPKPKRTIRFRKVRAQAVGRYQWDYEVWMHDGKRELPVGRIYPEYFQGIRGVTRGGWHWIAYPFPPEQFDYRRFDHLKDAKAWVIKKLAEDPTLVTISYPLPNPPFKMAGVPRKDLAKYLRWLCEAGLRAEAHDADGNEVGAVWVNDGKLTWYCEEA